MSDTWNRIKGKAEEDPYAKDNAEEYDKTLKIKRFTQSEGGKIYRKNLIHNAVTSIHAIINVDVSNTNEVIRRIAQLNADIKVLQEFDGVENTAESLYETLKEFLE